MSCADPLPAPSAAPGSADAVLAREAGVLFAPVQDSAAPTGPFVKWLSLMEVVEVLCPAWPVREQPIRGAHWRL